MKKLLLAILSLTILVSCSWGKNSVKWYKNGSFGSDAVHECRPNGKFVIFSFGEEWILSIHAESGDVNTILFVTDYLSTDEKLYAFSKAGYGVVDEVNNTARILVLDAKANYNDYTDDGAVSYLTSFDEFSEEEKDVFVGMNAFWNGRDDRTNNLQYIVDLDGEIRPYAYSLDREQFKEKQFLEN